MKLCKECVNNKGGMCNILYTNPVSGNENMELSCLHARIVECYCGAEAKYFQPKEQKKYTFFEAVQAAFDNPNKKYRSIKYDSCGYVMSVEDGILMSDLDNEFCITDDDIVSMWVEVD